jgi:tRNA(fMet)-specific endonuclease VapC
MTKYLLDTGPLAAYLLGRPAVVPLVTGWLANNQAATSIVVYGEVIEYLKGLPHYQRYRRQLLELMPTIPPHALTYAILEQYADIRRVLRVPYGPGLIGDMDTLIAATALEYDLTVVTFNEKDFTHVPRLKLHALPHPHSKAA